MINQFCGLERRVARGGRDSIDHAPGAHDDLANCIAGLAAIAKRGGYQSDLKGWVSEDDGADAAQRWLEGRYLNHIRAHSGYYFSRWR